MRKNAIFLGHPAHFHLFKNVAKNLLEKGHEVKFVIKQKDILEQLLQNAGFSYEVVRENERKKSSKLGLILSLLQMDWKMFKFLRKYKPDILIGTYIAFFVKFTHTKFISVNEDDSAVAPLFSMTSYPLANAILNPRVCNSGKWDKKAVKYNSFQKLAYLHPNHFIPDIELVKKYIDTSKPYFLIRFAKLNAHHDVGISGISTEIAEKLFAILEQKGNIYITSERELEPQFEKYRLQTNPLDIHHIMAFAELYVGDSQSMAVEAAMLGVPSVRFNDFAGRIGVLEELQSKYQLTFGIKSNEPQKLYDKVTELLSMDNLRDTFQQRRQKMLSGKIDTTKFFTWFIENYPESKKIMRENPDYQYNFK